MKIALSLSLLLFVSSHALGSANYMSSSPSLIKLAIEDAFTVTAGVGVKEGTCFLCHTSASGGAATINNNTFGVHFRSASSRLGLGTGSGLSQTQLATIFGDATFGALDSDSDGSTNAAEMAADSDPASNVGTTSGTSTDGGGGCGTVVPLGSSKPPWQGPLALLTLPLLLVGLLFRQKKARLH